MSALRPDTRLHDYAAEAYAKEVQVVANRLRHCADAVARRGGADAGTHTEAARYVINTVVAALASLGLDRLVQLAQQADPPADTPAVLLDRAASALAAAMFDKPDADDDARAVELAEAALRGAGVLR